MSRLSDVLYLCEVLVFLQLCRLITKTFSLSFALCLSVFSSYQNQCASALGSTVLRCDKLDRDEIKNLLMCFLHILKSMSEGRTSLLYLIFKQVDINNRPRVNLFSLYSYCFITFRGLICVLEQSSFLRTNGLLYINRVSTELDNLFVITYMCEM